MIVVSFENYHPSPRFDGIPWTRAVIDEATTAEGPWNTIDTVVFSDPDANPAEPKLRSFTTDNATILQGWYRVTFTDTFGQSTQPTAPVYNGPDQLYEPTIDQVARKILSRTRDTYGTVTGTFSDKTQPTDAQVAAIIGDVMTEVADVIGDEIPEVLLDDASNVVALRAAMQIEVDFYADQINTGRSPYPQLKEMYEENLANLQQQVVAIESGGGTGPVDDAGGSGFPQYSFPDSSTSIGLNTRW